MARQKETIEAKKQKDKEREQKITSNGQQGTNINGIWGQTEIRERPGVGNGRKVRFLVMKTGGGDGYRVLNLRATDRDWRG